MLENVIFFKIRRQNVSWTAIFGYFWAAGSAFEIWLQKFEEQKSFKLLFSACFVRV